MEKGIWKKSSRSNGTGGSNCVEVVDNTYEILVRDSKFPHDGVLSFTQAEWKAFIEGVKLGEFDI